MRTKLISAVISATLLYTFTGTICAQTYTQTPVTISKDKIKGSDGKIYYCHVVMDKQTLFSIAKAYGVSADEIAKANPATDIQSGLKKGSILLIPVKQDTSKNTSTEAEKTKKQDKDEKDSDYTIHVAKWYEDIDDIAYKYSIPAEILMEYNGLTSSKLSNRQKLRIPSVSKVNELISARRNSGNQIQSQNKETVTEKSEPAYQKDKRTYEGDSEKSAYSKVNMLLMLPLGANSSPSESNIDFYSGVLLAVNDMKEQGISTDLSVYDVSGGSLPITTERLRASDFSIGPVNKESVEKVLSLSPENTYIISPLDHKTSSLLPYHRNLIQAPAMLETQYKDLLNWLGKERRAGDKVIVISEKGAARTSSSELMIQVIGNSGIPYSQYSYTILQGREVAESLPRIMTANGTNRIIINSESEAFVNDAIRNLDMLVYKKYDIVLYSPSKIRSFETIDVENLHNLKTRVSTSYYIDYESPEVKRFLLEYRALFNSEPTQFSFQGYDLAKYFISMKAKYGSSWMRYAEHAGNAYMLQTDIKLRELGNGGYMNEGVRRIVYGTDFSIRISR